MRILIVNDLFAPLHVGGAETVVTELARGLSARGHTVVVATAGVRGLASRERSGDVEVVRIGRFPGAARSIRLASGATPQPAHPDTLDALRGLVSEVRPDVIHFHNVWLLGPPILGIDPDRSVVTFHDFWPFCGRRTMVRVGGALCGGPDAVGCRLCRLRAASCLGSLDLLHVERDRERVAALLQRCRRVVAPSKYLADRVGREIDVPVGVVYNGVQTPPPARQAPAEEPYALFASRLTRDKGHDVIVEVFRRQLPEHSLHILGGDATMSRENIRYLGRRRHGDALTHIRGAACLVVPSLWPENCPMVVLEALSVGTPVVASRLGGLPELVEEEKSGLLVRSGDREALAGGIRRCLTDVEFRRTCRALAASPDSTRSLDFMVKKYEELYGA